MERVSLHALKDTSKDQLTERVDHVQSAIVKLARLLTAQLA